ncbi:MAG: PD40 domain-containing protein, partial [Luteimonas sp.]|nr:PD40 domain-containing protein [Luteimonas sp.]
RVRDCEVDAMRRVVVRADGGSLRLTVKAMQVLLVLVEQRGAVVSREALFERVWPDTMPTDDVLTQAVAQLRKAFADDRDAPRYIETISKGGYRLIADVEWLDAGAAATAAGDADADAATSDSAADAGPAATIGEGVALPPVRAKSTRAWPWLAAGAAALLAGLAVLRPWSTPKAAPAADPPAAAIQAPIALNYRALTSLPGQERQPALSPDGSTVAFTGRQRGDPGSAIQLQGTTQVSARRLTAPPPDGDDQMPVWSRDGTRIAFVRTAGSRCDLMVIAVNGGEERKVGDCFRRAYSSFDWTPDGRGLVMGALRDQDESSGPLRILDLASGEWRKLEYGIADDDTDLIPRYSPDGRWLAFRRNTSLADLWMMPAEGGEPRRLTTLRGDIRGWDWLPDGSGIVFSHVTTEASLFLYTLADGAIRPLPPLSSGNAVYPDIALKDWSMVFEIDQSRSGLFRFLPGDGGARAVREPVFPSTGVDLLPAISPDGTTLAFFSDRTMSVQLWLGEVGQPATLRAIEGLTPVPRHPPVWSADGHALLVVGKTVAGDRLFEVDAASGTVRALAVPDGSPAFAAYAGGRDRLLVGGDSGQGRLRLVLYALPDWRVLGAVDDVAIARHDPVGGYVYFTRPSRIGMWRADATLREVEEVSGRHPVPQHYRQWGLVEGRPFYSGPSGNCGMVWRPLREEDGDRGVCLSRQDVAIAGSPGVDRVGGWIYFALPVNENIDVGRAALPPSMRAIAAQARAEAPKKNEQP